MIKCERKANKFLFYFIYKRLEEEVKKMSKEKEKGGRKCISLLRVKKVLLLHLLYLHVLLRVVLVHLLKIAVAFSILYQLVLYILRTVGFAAREICYTEANWGVVIEREEEEKHFQVKQIPHHHHHFFFFFESLL